MKYYLPILMFLLFCTCEVIAQETGIPAEVDVVEDVNAVYLRLENLITQEFNKLEKQRSAEIDKLELDILLVKDQINHVKAGEQRKKKDLQKSVQYLSDSLLQKRRDMDRIISSRKDIYNRLQQRKMPLTQHIGAARKANYATYKNHIRDFENREKQIVADSIHVLSRL